MYRPEVIDPLSGRVGFRNTTQAGYAGLVTAPHTTSASGRYYDEFHSIVTVPNLKDLVNNDPAISGTDFNTYLQQLQTGAIHAVLAGIFSKPELIEQQMIYERDDQEPEVILNGGQFVGYMIQVANRTNLSVHVNALSLLFNGAGTFNVYVFNHLKPTPIKEIEVTVAPYEEVIQPVDDVILSAISSANKSRTFFVGYFQDDIEALGIQALDYGIRLKREAACFSAEGVECIKTAAADFNRYNPPMTGRSYGINIEMSSYRDYTEVILRNKQLFDKAIGLQMAAMVIERGIHSTRSNGYQRLGEAGVKQLYTDLNLAFSSPEFPYTTGIKNQISREIDRIYKNIFPKDKPKSITSPSEQRSE